MPNSVYHRNQRYSVKKLRKSKKIAHHSHSFVPGQCNHEHVSLERKNSKSSPFKENNIKMFDDDILKKLNIDNLSNKSDSTIIHSTLSLDD